MNIHEHQAKKILKNYGAKVPNGIFSSDVEDLIQKAKTLETDMNTTYAIYDILTGHKGPLISESGIKTKEELLDISKKTKIKTFLIGESLLKNLEKNSIFSVL